jgi:hypothetical protein
VLVVVTLFPLNVKVPVPENVHPSTNVVPYHPIRMGAVSVPAEFATCAAVAVPDVFILK